MKIGIMTLYHKNYNYGAMLQSYALTNFINQVKVDTAYQIDYQFKEYSYSLFFYQKLLKCKNFVDKIPHTEFFNNKTNLFSLNEKFELFICGGDQIWNPYFFNKQNFLSEIYKPKISYAASIAVTKLTQEQSKIIPLINDFSHIGLREESGKNLLQEHNITKDMTVVVDPVVLISVEQWRNIAQYPLKNRDYSFACFLKDNQIFRNISTNISHTYKLPLVNIPYINTIFNSYDEFFGDFKFEQAGPEEFLGLIDGSKVVFSDSFHCIVFSIIFKKQFFAFLRDSNNPTTSMNSRITDLLKDLGLSHRIINSEKDITQELLNEKIDYDKVFILLNEKLQISLDFLRNAFKGTELEEGLNNLDFTIN